jgi:hypothetical protein
LGTTITDENLIQEEIKTRLDSGNACHHSVQNLSLPPSSAVPVILYGCEIWSLRLREKHRQRVFENRVQRRIFGPKMDYVMRASPSIIGMIRSGRMR